ncbi:branched-chain amino acid ABC transporter permease [Planktotalea sp.]|uniref:branched-chain amino acid ABC transporter permease n=1 Tax=Planktotalea sp. TaxID=2029877 RepID=UPI0032970598
MRLLFVLLPLVLVPLIANDFWLSQVITRALILGIIALSLCFLATYLGVVSFAQVTLAGVAGYAIAYFGPNTVGLGIPLPLIVTIPLALILAMLAGAMIGYVARRSRGIYAIMITLAIGVAFFYFTRQNYVLFNGFTGFSGVIPPALGDGNWGDAVPLYYLTLLVATICVVLVQGFVRSPLGLAVQAVRDAPGRLLALGIPTTLPIVAAFAFSGLIAGSGGILNVWYQERVSSFSVGIGPIIDILIIAVIGGLRHPTGAFVGAIVYVVLDIFAIDLIDRDRFNLLIGIVLLLIIIAAPNGLSQLAIDWAKKLRGGAATSRKT